MKYIKGNLFEHLTSEYICIPHIVNNCGQWGAGFVVPLSKKWPISLNNFSPEFVYRHYIHELSLGFNQLIEVNDNIVVANMCAQDNRDMSLKRKVHYGYLAKCMADVVDTVDNEVKIFAPKFGAGIGGGDWTIIEELIQAIWEEFEVTIFELE